MRQQFLGSGLSPRGQTIRDKLPPDLSVHAQSVHAQSVLTRCGRPRWARYGRASGGAAGGAMAKNVMLAAVGLALLAGDAWLNQARAGDAEFVAYRNSGDRASLLIHTSGQAGFWLVEDMTLLDDACAVVEYTVTVQSNEPFTMQAELWDACEPAAVIPGTEGTYVGVGNGQPEVATITLPAPVTLASDTMYMAIQFDVAEAGVLLADQAEVGETNAGFGLGQPGVCSIEIDQEVVGFEASVTCDGEEPTGACCGPVKNMPGGPVCTVTTITSCLDELQRFVEGAMCPGMCSVDGFNCSVDADCAPSVCEGSLAICDEASDCPAGEDCVPQDCVEPGDVFDPPCGSTACCTPPEYAGGEGCHDLPQAECQAITDNEGNAAVSSDATCDDHDCPPWVCVNSEGACDQPHGGIGCEDTGCCQRICAQDGWCCVVEWDQTCADRAQDSDFGCFEEVGEADLCESAAVVDISTGVCSGGFPCDPVNGNDDCPGLEVCNLPRVTLSTVGATQTPDERFCCPSILGGTAQTGSAWARFTAVTTSVVIRTLSFGSQANDPVIEVYDVLDPASPESSCDSLVPIGCDDDSGINTHAELVLHDLVVGQAYYVQLAAKYAEESGEYFVEFDWLDPPADASPPNDSCENAIAVASGAVQSVNLVGANVECPLETCLPSTDPNTQTTLQNDVWFEFVADATGEITIDTCSVAGSSLTIYAGGLCPPTLEERVACAGDGPDGCDGAEVTFAVTAGQSYLVRVGGDEGSEPTGDISIGSVGVVDCNGNGVDDALDIQNGTSDDCDGNSVPDECDIDSDGDSVPDKCDVCPGFDDLDDQDGDGLPRGCDPCPTNARDNDSDNDGVCFPADRCPKDPNKTEPGDCGCGRPDLDENGDGMSDCLRGTIPTVSTWGLIILALSLMTLAKVGHLNGPTRA